MKRYIHRNRREAWLEAWLMGTGVLVMQLFFVGLVLWGAATWLGSTLGWVRP